MVRKIIKFINNGPGTFLPSGACNGSRRSSAMTQSIGFGFLRAVLLVSPEAGYWVCILCPLTWESDKDVLLAAASQKDLELRSISGAGCSCTIQATWTRLEMGAEVRIPIRNDSVYILSFGVGMCALRHRIHGLSALQIRWAI